MSKTEYLLRSVLRNVNQIQADDEFTKNRLSDISYFTKAAIIAQEFHEQYTADDQRGRDKLRDRSNYFLKTIDH